MVYVNLKSCANLLNVATLLLLSKYEAHFDCFSPDQYRSMSDLCFVVIGRKERQFRIRSGYACGFDLSVSRVSFLREVK